MISGSYLAIACARINGKNSHKNLEHIGENFEENDCGVIDLDKSWTILKVQHCLKDFGSWFFNSFLKVLKKSLGNWYQVCMRYWMIVFIDIELINGKRLNESIAEKSQYIKAIQAIM